MTGVFEVLAAPPRRHLLDLLLVAPRSVGELVTATGMSQPNTSRHLRVLREAGMVTSRASGRDRIYEIRPEGIEEIARWLTPFVIAWQSGAARRSSPLG